MKNATKGEHKMVHTAERRTVITKEEYQKLIEDKSIQWKRDERGKTSGHIRALAPHGITDIQPNKTKAKGDFRYYDCTIIANLQRIVNNGARTIETYNNEQDFFALSSNFARFIQEVLPLRTDINQWSLQRIDYNIDLKLSPCEVEQYITLLQRGGKNYSWMIHETTDETKKRKQSKHGHRKKMHPTGSVLFDTKQYSVNIYNKHFERLKVQEKRGITDTAELKASEGILRIEIQVKRNKLNTIKQGIKRDFDFEGKPIQVFARYDVAIPIIMKTLQSITGSADYTTYKNAESKVLQWITRERIQTDIMGFLQLVRNTKSLWRAKELYNGSTKIETILEHLNRLNINPVTIPPSFGRDSMENLFDKVAVLLCEKAHQSTTICHSHA